MGNQENKGAENAVQENAGQGTGAKGQSNKDNRENNRNLAGSSASRGKGSPQNSPKAADVQMPFGRSGANSSLSNNATINPKLNQEKTQRKIGQSSNKVTSSNHFNQKDIKSGRNTKQNADDNQNEFMPMMKLSKNGQIKLKITLIQMILVKKPKAHLNKKSASYNGTLSWSKSWRNNFTFTLKQEEGYQLQMQIDIQGNIITGKSQFWCVLCPINIPFGQTVKVGQMNCVNWYVRLANQEDDKDDAKDDILGPSVKNIDFKINESVFEKWDQEIPDNFHDPDQSNVLRKIHQNKKKTAFTSYKQLSRYFDQSNVWRASTFVQQTTKYFKSCVFEVVDQNSAIQIGKQIHKDIKNREEAYAKQIYQIHFGDF